MTVLVVTGTDTDVGKTVFAAGLARSLGAFYWKPVQAGLDDGGDGATARRLGVPADRILPEAYRLTTPCSPHLAAERDGVAIATDRLLPPAVGGPLVIEGAGGALVPVTRNIVYADLFAAWGHPVVIVARTALGTINHSLLTIEALRARGVPILGVAFIGDAAPDSENIVADLGRVRRVGRLPQLTTLSAETLQAAFADAFRMEDFR